MSKADAGGPQASLFHAKRVAAGELLTGEFSYSIVEVTPEPPRRPARPAAARPTDAPPVTRAAKTTSNDAERRDKKRQATRLRDAHIEERRGRVLVDCRIKDLSATGARLLLHAETALPKTFMLCDGTQDLRFTATLAWQRGREAGVKLTPIATR